MYLPESFSETDPARILALIESHPLATMITVSAGVPYISHVPLLADTSEKQIKLIGHLARANPHAGQLENATCLAILHGPDAYVSPNWYETAGVPTWNYVVAHLHGQASLVTDETELESLLTKITKRFEAAEPSPWEYKLDGEQRQRLLGAIIGFEITVESIEAKFKLSQNRSASERNTIKAKLSASAPELVRLMS